jgi:hypothetical protein
MGHRPDWQRQSYKKVKHMADGGDPSLHDTEYDSRNDNYEAPVEVNYSGADDSGVYSGQGRIGHTRHFDDDQSVNMGVSGSHWVGRGQKGSRIDSLDATYRNKGASIGASYSPEDKSIQSIRAGHSGDYGNFNLEYKPKDKRVQFTFYKEF